MKTIQQKFDFYIETVGLGTLPKDSVQYIEIKRGFFAGVASTIVELYTEEKAEKFQEELSSITKEVETFWESEAERSTKEHSEKPPVVSEKFLMFPPLEKRISRKDNIWTNYICV